MRAWHSYMDVMLRDYVLICFSMNHRSVISILMPLYAMAYCC